MPQHVSEAAVERRADPNLAPTRVIPHTRPLYFDGGKLFCSRFDRILSTDDYGKTFRPEGKLDLEMKFRGLIGAVPLTQRITRSTVYRMRVLPDGGRVYLMRGGVYTQKAGEEVAVRTYAVTSGSRPVSLAVSRDGVVAFGEYIDNSERGPIHIYASHDSGMSWAPVYTFPAGSIRHVHGVSYDPWDDCFWVCAGDYELENQLLRMSTDFRDVRMLRQGGQGNRFYSLLVTEDHLITATDTPLEQNYICLINKRDGALRHLASIENTSFYSCEVRGKIFVSTNAEPSPVNDRSASHIWMGDVQGEPWHRVFSFPVDVFDHLGRLPGLPNALFQFPRVFFPEGHNPGKELVCYGLGVRGFDDKMYCYDTTAWDG